ncbi:RloB family protein [Capnocytophaga canis]|uniref:RloB family protein n=1 Tax=Capnocytophaga canis TaxID=1848903 RepID=UPI0015624781|nr:RloB family protein [Capnocytophaga canis]
MKGQYLTRNRVYTKQEPSKDAKKIYIFCEGEKKEVRYFNYFQGLDSRINILPIPNEDGKSDPMKLKQNAEESFFPKTGNPKKDLSKEYNDEVWFVIDTDRWNEGNKIETLKQFADEKSNNENKWEVVQSNPCFEVWLYYHFFVKKPLSKDVNSFDSFKAYLDGSIKGGFDNRKHPVLLEKAIQNAEANYNEQNNQSDLYSTQVFRLGKSILPFVKDKLI